MQIGGVVRQAYGARIVTPTSSAFSGSDWA
jgi:hypothetical protein